MLAGGTLAVKDQNALNLTGSGSAVISVTGNSTLRSSQSSGALAMSSQISMPSNNVTLTLGGTQPINFSNKIAFTASTGGGLTVATPVTIDTASGNAIELGTASARTITVNANETLTVNDRVDEPSTGQTLTKSGLGRLIFTTANPTLLGSILVKEGVLTTRDANALGPNPTAQQTFKIQPLGPTSTGNFSEVQQLHFSGLNSNTAGSFVLNYGAGVSPQTVVWDSSAITSTAALNAFINSQSGIVAALNNLFGPGNVAVSVASATPAQRPFHGYNAQSEVRRRSGRGRHGSDPNRRRKHNRREL